MQEREAAGHAARSPPVSPKTTTMCKLLIRINPSSTAMGALENETFTHHDVLLVSLLLDVFVCSLDVLNVHRTELA